MGLECDDAGVFMFFCDSCAKGLHHGMKPVPSLFGNETYWWPEKVIVLGYGVAGCEEKDGQYQAGFNLQFTSDKTSDTHTVTHMIHDSN